jgi:LPXTG-motif cell wall-anchored protein
MPMRLSIGIAAAIACAITGSTMGQTRSSFTNGSLSGVTLLITNGGLNYNVAVGGMPTLTIGAQTFPIIDIFGFWALSNDDDLVASNSSFGVWGVDNSNSGPGGIAGWDTNPNTGLFVNQSAQFNFSALNVASVESYGYHVRIDGIFPGTQGNTGFVNNVPTPAGAALLGLGGAFVSRRRRR